MRSRLLDAHAMLAGQHAADLDAEPQDVRAEGFRPFRVALDRRIVENERMQVAVARVKTRWRPAARGFWRARPSGSATRASSERGIVPSMQR